MMKPGHSPCSIIHHTLPRIVGREVSDEAEHPAGNRAPSHELLERSWKDNDRKAEEPEVKRNVLEIASLSYEVIPSATVWWAQSEVCGLIYISSTPYNTSNKSSECSRDYVHCETLSVGILASSGTFNFQQVAAWGVK
jgi:hypothetical protein